MHCGILEHSCSCLAPADVLAALQMTMTVVTGVATTPSTTEVIMVITMAGTTAMVAQLQQPQLGEVQLLLQLLLLAGIY